MNRKVLGTLAGAAALGIGIGLQRSQFGVLGELMSEHGWFKGSMIGVLGGLSLWGYIIGCIHQGRLKNELTNIKTVRIGLALAVMSFFIEPLIAAQWWQVLWRMIAGWASAQLVTGIPGLGIRHHSIDDKRRALAFIFAGAGIAALLGSVSVSLIASNSVVNSWVVTGILAVVMAIPIHLLLDLCIEEELLRSMASRSSTDELQPLEPSAAPAEQNASAAIQPGAQQRWSRGLKLLAASTLCFGAGQVTVLTYYPLLLVSKFGVSEAAAQASFANVGLGYTLGALATGYMPRRWSTDTLMTASAIIGVVGTAVCAAAGNVPAAGLGGFAFALWNGSMMGLLLHRINISVPAEDARKTWSQFSLILSIGFLLFSFISSALAGVNVSLIIWSGALLALLHLGLQVQAKRALAMGS